MDVVWQIVLPGIPLTSNRGALGWVSVCLVHSGTRLLLVDTGFYGDRSLLLERLRELDVRPEDVTDLFLTHFHFDHVLNCDLFPKAVIHMPETERDYVQGARLPTGRRPFVPAVRYSCMTSALKTFHGEVEIMPGIRTVPLLGSTPSLTGLLLEQEGVLIASEAIKNARDFDLGKIPPVFGDPDRVLASYQCLETLADVIIPGHDSPFRQSSSGSPIYLDRTHVKISFSNQPDHPPQDIHLMTGGNKDA